MWSFGSVARRLRHMRRKFHRRAGSYRFFFANAILLIIYQSKYGPVVAFQAASDIERGLGSWYSCLGPSYCTLLDQAHTASKSSYRRDSEPYIMRRFLARTSSWNIHTRYQYGKSKTCHMAIHALFPRPSSPGSTS